MDAVWVAGAALVVGLLVHLQSEFTDDGQAELLKHNANTDAILRQYIH